MIEQIAIHIFKTLVYKKITNNWYKKEKFTLSANIRAPASMTNSPDSSSLATAAVKPAALEALPLV